MHSRKTDRLVLHISMALLWCCCLLCIFSPAAAQQEEQQDTVFFLAHKKGLLGKIGKSLSVNNAIPLLPQEGAIRNEAEFQPFNGRIIRHITVLKTGFRRSVNDTSREISNVFNNLGDALHNSTMQRVIRNNLFFTKGDTLYSQLFADNERFLRSISYIQDARITVQEDPVNPDSVDVVVICKDVFPVGGSMDAGSEKMASFEVNDDNLFGTGNRIQIRNLFDKDRNPDYGIGFEFLKRNLAGSFLNLAAGYRNEMPTFNSGHRQERNLYVQGELPLVSPYHTWTGAFEVAEHKTKNSYLSDSIYKMDFKYSYRIMDGWIGYNIGARKKLQQNLQTRSKKIIALRGAYRKFTDVPDLFKSVYNFNYSNITSVLASFTLFDQDFYHTNFIYGFGRNEDIPEGYNISFTGGWTNRNQVSRPYAGFEYQRNYFSNKKNYLNYALRLSTYFDGRRNRFEDIVMFSSIEYFTRLHHLGSGNWYNRTFLSGSLAQLINTVLNDPLRLSSDYGIPQLNNPDLQASTRATFNAETVFYNTWKLAGFSFAPFAFGNITYLKPLGRYLETGDVYTAIGGGIRSRNENLVFGTMELKAAYYPRATFNVTPWVITFNTDLRFRYISQLVKRPDFVTAN
jgi:hypothetical protein